MISELEAVAHDPSLKSNGSVPLRLRLQPSITLICLALLKPPKTWNIPLKMVEHEKKAFTIIIKYNIRIRIIIYNVAGLHNKSRKIDHIPSVPSSMLKLISFECPSKSIAIGTLVGMKVFKIKKESLQISLLQWVQPFGQFILHGQLDSHSDWFLDNGSQ